MMTNANYPINPSDVQITSKGEVYQNQVSQDTFTASGLTIREHFASLAMQGMLNNGAMTEHAGLSFSPGTIAMLAVNQADELIKALNK